MTPAALSLCAAAGHESLTVTRRPRLALLMTGDELVPPGALPGPDQIVASNAAGLGGLFGPLTERIRRSRHCGDDAAVLRESSAPHSPVTPMSSSRPGAPVLATAIWSVRYWPNSASTLDLWRIAVRPGKPLMFARAGDKLVFGLPGNPVSTLTTAMVLVVPALRALAGDTNPGPHFVTLPLAEDLVPTVRAVISAAPALPRILTACASHPSPKSTGAHLSSFATADCLMVHEEHAPPLRAGTARQGIFLVAVPALNPRGCRTIPEQILMFHLRSDSRWGQPC